MRDTVLTWLASLRIRLIITYVLVTAFSFGLLLLLILKPVEQFMLKREVNTMAFLARTIGSTVRDPWKFSQQAWQEDQFWTQRRSADISAEIGVRIRMLDPRGHVLTDSDWGHCGSAEWQQLLRKRERLPSLASLTEVRMAVCGEYHPGMRVEGDKQIHMMYVARPIFRKRADTGKRAVAFILYISKPMDSVMADLRTLNHLIRYEIFASMLITIFVSILLSGHLAGGLQSATQVARAFAHGEMTQRMRARGRDEVGQLGAAFNQMATALQRQEQLRRDLLADVSHELRTPLTAIAGCADTLADGALQDPAAAEQFLGIIHRESERLQRLVSDILELSKLQAGVTEIRLQPIPLRPVIDDAVEIARLHAAPENIEIASVFPTAGHEVMVLGNEDRLAQALRNLLDNARHHTPAGKVITVIVEPVGEEVIIHVHDEGEGIPEEDIPWVLDRFYRAGKGNSKVSGTGLGLAIVREIIHAHGGKVTVESQVGVGTSFSLHLQRVQAE